MRCVIHADLYACIVSVCFSLRFTCRRSCGSPQPLWSSRERSLFFSFSGMNNIPSAGERAYQEANGKGREIAGSVTDKSVAQVVSLTAPWGWGQRASAPPECQARLLPAHTQTNTLTHIHTHRQTPQPGCIRRSSQRRLTSRRYSMLVHLQPRNHICCSRVPLFISETNKSAVSHSLHAALCFPGGLVDVFVCGLTRILWLSSNCALLSYSGVVCFPSRKTCLVFIA